MKLIENVTRAQQAFDPCALAQLLAPDYLEVSPTGEVDTRDQVLSFYRPAAGRRGAPDLSIDEPRVRRFGDVGIVIVRLSYRSSGSDGSRVFSLRATFVAHRDPDGESGNNWRLVSAHYTPMRVARS